MDVIALVSLALKVISERLLVILCLLLSFGLSCWVMYSPSYERLATMAFFSIFSYLCIRNKDVKHENPKTPE